MHSVILAMLASSILMVDQKPVCERNGHGLTHDFSTPEWTESIYARLVAQWEG